MINSLQHLNPKIFATGKGVSYMERDFKWHGSPPGITDMKGEPPKAEQVNIALKELRTLGGQIKSEHE